MFQITDSGRREAIIFRRFTRETLAAIGTLQAINLTEPSSNGVTTTEALPASLDDIETVELLVNPSEASFSTPRDTQQVRTASRGQYVVQDWGPGLTKLKLSLQTGNLLPYASGLTVTDFPELTSFFQPTVPNSGRTGPTQDDYIAALEGRVTTVPGGILSSSPTTGSTSFSSVKTAIVQPMTQKENFDTYGLLRASINAGYTGLLLRSDRYITLLQLLALFNKFDANRDVLFMTFGQAMFRGYFEGEFEFTINAEQPWNWKYGLTFVVLQGFDTFAQGSLLAEAGDMNQLLRSYGAVDPGDLVLRSPFAGQGRGGSSVPDNSDLGFSQARENYNLLRSQERTQIRGQQVPLPHDQASTVIFTQFGFTGALGAIFDGLASDQVPGASPPILEGSLD